MPLGPTHDGYKNNRPFVASETVDISSIDHTFARGPANALVVTASGDVSVKLNEDGATLTVPVVVASNDYEIFPKTGTMAIVAVIKATTSATVTSGLY